MPTGILLVGRMWPSTHEDCRDALAPDLCLFLAPVLDVALAHSDTLAIMISFATPVPVIAAAAETSPTAWWALLIAGLALLLSGFNTLRTVRRETNAKPHWVGRWEMGAGGLASLSPAVHFSAVNLGLVEARSVNLFVGASRGSLEPVQSRISAPFEARIEGWLSLASEQVAVTECFMSPNGVLEPLLPKGECIHKRVYAQIEYRFDPDLHKPRKSKVWSFKVAASHPL